MTASLTGLFQVAWTIGVAAWFLGIVEAIGVWRFWPWAYRNGLKVLDESISDLPLLRPGATIDLPLVRGEVRSATEVFLRVPFQTFSLKVHTPFPIKGTIVLTGGKTRLVGRLPIGTLAFLAAWLVGWTAGGVIAWTSNETSGPIFLLLGWTVAILMVGISLPLEFRRIRRASDALVDYLAEK